ncbi:MAG: L-seryl-tRNA(Sec) selenium transferase [Chloroflexota bacterium]
MSEFRHLPGVDRVLAEERIKQLEGLYSRALVLGLVREQLEKERRAIAAGQPAATLEALVTAVEAQMAALQQPGLRPVINATGVIIHTNLGRAPLSRDALSAMVEASRSYSNLEFDMESGSRGSRLEHIEGLLCRLTGAEAGIVVNNNAAGVLLGLTALAKRKEVVVSRSQAVEIGGGFRIPDVMRQSGARLVEVGTTNCTYAADYEQAVTPRTAALLRVHSSNFRLVGFTSETTLEDMVAVATKNGLPVFDDLGSGCFLDTTAYGLAPEPMVTQSVAAGAALVFFSGDKLVGGPQAGIIVGRKEYMVKLRKHPLLRAMRLDKTRLAALAATLLHYLNGEAETKIPVWRMIAAPLADIERRAEAWAKALGGSAQVVPGETMVGGGSLPGGTLPTCLLKMGGGGKKDQKLALALGRRLRLGEPPVIGRVSENALLLDPRTVLPEDDELVCGVLRKLSDSGTVSEGPR